MIPALRDLRLVEPALLLLHEAREPSRLSRLVSRMSEEDVQRNPAIVSPYENGYLVLDGVHRVRALYELGYPLVLVQVVEVPATVESWAHLVEGEVEERLRLREEFEEVSQRPQGGCLAEVELPRERTYLRLPSPDLSSTVRALWALQEVYAGAEVRRLDPGAQVYPPEEGAVFRYRRFTPGELVEVVRMGEVLPAGITRFQIRERVLGVRFPLEELKSRDVAAANERLEEFVRESWERGRVRYYPEPVVLFE